jgi:hypothetical protein
LGNSKINRGRKRLGELRESAVERIEARATRSNSEQIKLLDTRLGKDCGAVKERKRLEVEVDGDGRSKTKTTKKGSGSTRQARKKEKAARHRAREERSA